MLNQIKRINKPYVKKNFSASDYGKLGIDLWFAFKGVPQSNPPEWYDRVKFGAGEGAELEILQALKDSDFVDEFYDQDFDGRIEADIDGITVTGYMDAWAKWGVPIEIKTINNKNSFDIANYSNGQPRENYVGQLAFYMEANNVEKGVLLVVSVDGLHRFWLDAEKIGEKQYKCGNVVVDLSQQIARWKRIQELLKEDEPSEGLIWEKVYKYPVEEIEWDKVSNNDISKARNGHKVIGDWEILYSPYKDLILELQGQEPGYTPEEMKYIKEVTKGYTSKK